MAKIFYTIEEAAEKLGVGEAEVRAMAADGRLQEFRDRDRLIFKKEQVDLLAGGADEDVGEDSGIPLADSGEVIALADEPAGSSVAPVRLEEAKERSGISIFDSDDEGADASAQTQITSSASVPAMSEPGGSGSGLLDLTREADDTSLGANLLDDVYEQPAGGPAGGEAEGGALFESTPTASDTSPGLTPAFAMVAAEPYDGAGSGLTGGLALAMIAVLVVALLVTLSGLAGGAFPLVPWFAANFWMGVGILAGVTAVLAVIGWVLGRRD